MSVELTAKGPSITFDHGEIHNLSIILLKALCQAESSAGDGALSCLLSAARLLAGHSLREEEELNFLLASMEWMGAYFAGGDN